MPRRARGGESCPGGATGVRPRRSQSERFGPGGARVRELRGLSWKSFGGQGEKEVPRRGQGWRAWAQAGPEWERRTKAGPELESLAQVGPELESLAQVGPELESLAQVGPEFECCTQVGPRARYVGRSWRQSGRVGPRRGRRVSYALGSGQDGLGRCDQREKGTPGVAGVGRDVSRRTGGPRWGREREEFPFQGKGTAGVVDGWVSPQERTSLPLSCVSAIRLGEEVDGDAIADLNLSSFGHSVEGSADGHKSSEHKSSQQWTTGEGGKGDGSEETAPFILGEALPVIPAKLVKKILKGEFVDMADLLKDNLEAERRRYSQENGNNRSSFAQPPCYKREVPDMLSWLKCFSLYAAAITSKYPHKARELWAYQALMVSEQRRCGGRGWLLYDSGFRQQITSLEATDFSKINQSLYSTTFLAYGGRGQFCPHCLSSDHGQEECALHPQRAVPVVRFKESGASLRDEWRLKPGELRRKRPRKGACFAWNDGRCTTQNCPFEHVCSKCFGDHRRAACRSRGGDQDQGKGAEEQRPAR